MMREIKFRLILDGKIVGQEVHEYNKENNHISIFHNGFNIEAVEDAEVQHNAKEQYTGLKDKEGAEIYEGDILKNKSTEVTTYTGKVAFSGGSFRFNYEADLWIQLATKKSRSLKAFEVIGNIHQNPELLKK